MRSCFFLSTVIIFCFVSSAPADMNDCASMRISSDFYTYDGDLLKVFVTVKDLKKGCEGLDLKVDSALDSGNFDVVEDNSAYSLQKTGPHSYKLHFDLKNKMEEVEGTGKFPSRWKEADCLFEIRPHSGFRYLINTEAVLTGPGDENEQVIYGPFAFVFLNLNPSFKNSFDRALAEARSEVWRSILDHQGKGGNLNLEFVEKLFPFKEFDLQMGDLTGKGRDQLVLKVGGYLGMGNSRYGVFVFDFDKSGYKKIYSKIDYELSAQVVKWNGNTGLLAADGGGDGEDSEAQLLLFKNGRFDSTLHYAYSNWIMHAGYSYLTVLDDRADGLKLYEMKAKAGLIGEPRCYEIKKRDLFWELKKRGFDLGPEIAMTGEDELESLKKAYPRVGGIDQVRLCK